MADLHPDVQAAVDAHVENERRKRELAVHYAGALSWRTEDGFKHMVSGGWAACCTGDRAERIRREGRGTLNAHEVTCRLCLANMARAGMRVEVPRG